MVGREVTSMRRAPPLANDSINAFTLSYKSAVLRLAPLNVYVHPRAHTHTHTHTHIVIIQHAQDVRAYVCRCDAGRNGNGRRSTRRFTVKALFE